VSGYSTACYTGLGSLKVIENYTIQSGTHDILLTFHSNHRPISHRFRDKRRYPSKITRKSPIFRTPVYLTPPLKGSPWNCVSAQGSQKTRIIGLSDGRKSFQIGLAVLIQYRRVTDTQPPSQPPTQPDTLP